MRPTPLRRAPRTLGDHPTPRSTTTRTRLLADATTPTTHLVPAVARPRAIARPRAERDRAVSRPGRSNASLSAVTTHHSPPSPLADGARAPAPDRPVGRLVAQEARRAESWLRRRLGEQEAGRHMARSSQTTWVHVTQLRGRLDQRRNRRAEPAEKQPATTRSEPND